MNTATMTDWDLVVHYCHYTGKGTLTEEQYRTAWDFADGFGPWTADHAEAHDYYGDWSHFRDSTEQATKRVADYLRALTCRTRKEYYRARVSLTGTCLKP